MSYKDWFRGLNSNGIATLDTFFKIGDNLNGQTISDENAIKKGYLGSSVVYSIVRKIASGISSLPIEIYDKANNEVIDSGEVYDFVFSPNENQGFNEFWEQLVTFYVLNGECYDYLDADSIGFFKGRQLVLPPQSVTIVTESQSIFSKVKKYQVNDGVNVQDLDPEYVMHVAMNNPTIQGLQTKNGLSPLQAAQNILNGSNNIEIAISEYFANRGVSALITPASGDMTQSLKPKDKTWLNSALNRVLGGAHKMNSNLVHDTPLNVQQLNASSSDMQTIENAIQLTRSLCAVFNFPSILVNDNSNSTYNNVKEAKKEAVTENYIPTFNKLASAYERKFLIRFGDYGLRIKKEEIEVLNESPTERRKEAREDVKAGIITPNEARQEIGLEESSDPNMNIATTSNGKAKEETK